jgi:nucleoside-diphosphate-sugar epimerase
MKVLLTGASGFVGSHTLEALRAHKIETALLLRPISERRFIEPYLSEVEVRPGAIADLENLKQAVAGVTHVIHCAGCTKASRRSQFYEVNHLGTQNVVHAVNAHRGDVQRLLLVSSLAVHGPATAANPAREADAPHPVSDYGKSKLAAEGEVLNHCKVPFTIIRPPAVYGPRDYGFLSMFRAVKAHILPRPSKRQALSVVYVKDLAEAIVRCLQKPEAAGKTYYAASPEVITGRAMAETIAAQMKRWTVPVPTPPLLLWPVCLLEQLRSQFNGKPRLLSLQKFAELRAPGWVCDPSRLARELGIECATKLESAIAQTLSWYVKEKWL